MLVMLNIVAPSIETFIECIPILSEKLNCPVRFVLKTNELLKKTVINVGFTKSTVKFLIVVFDEILLLVLFITFALKKYVLLAKVAV